MKKYLTVVSTSADITTSVYIRNIEINIRTQINTIQLLTKQVVCLYASAPIVIFDRRIDIAFSTTNGNSVEINKNQIFSFLLSLKVHK